MIKYLLLLLLLMHQYASEKICKPNFTMIGDLCYSSFTGNARATTYSEQRNTCKDIPGTLPCPINEEEKNALMSFRSTNEEFFIGLSCVAERDDPLGEWKWDDGREYHLAQANFLPDDEVDPLECNATDSDLAFIFDIDGNWRKSSISKDKLSYFICQIAQDDNDDTSDTGNSWIGTVAYVLGGIVIAALIALCVYRGRKKRHEMNALIKQLRTRVQGQAAADQEAPTDVNSGIGRITSFNLHQHQIFDSKDGWEVPRQCVDINWTKKLGNGAFGTVYLGMIPSDRLPENSAQSIIQVSALKKNEDQVAIKMLHESADRTAELSFLDEIELMKTLGYHERLVNMLACVTESQPPMLIIEYCNKGDLLHYMKQRREYMLRIDTEDDLDWTQVITQKQQYMFAVQIAYGLEYLSNRGFVHRDIAARNILVDCNDACKIGDFGLCRKIQSENELYLSRGGRLPLKWMSPEALRHYEMSTASDVWSYGVLLFEIVTLGGSPYADWAPAEILPRLEAGERMQKPDRCPESMFAVMNDCWKNEPKDRPDFNTIRTKVATALEEIDSDDYYLKLDGQQHYYLVGSDHDKSVPEDFIIKSALLPIGNTIHAGTIQQNVARLSDVIHLSREDTIEIVDEELTHETLQSIKRPNSEKDDNFNELTVEYDKVKDATSVDRSSTSHNVLHSGIDNYANEIDDRPDFHHSSISIVSFSTDADSFIGVVSAAGQHQQSYQREILLEQTEHELLKRLESHHSSVPKDDSILITAESTVPSNLQRQPSLTEYPQDPSNQTIKNRMIVSEAIVDVNDNNMIEDGDLDLDRANYDQEHFNERLI